MNKGALALIVKGGSANWSPERWKNRFEDVCDDRRVFLLPDAHLDSAAIHYAAVWKPAPGELAAFPNLRVNVAGLYSLSATAAGFVPDTSSFFVVDSIGIANTLRIKL